MTLVMIEAPAAGLAVLIESSSVLREDQGSRGIKEDTAELTEFRQCRQQSLSRQSAGHSCKPWFILLATILYTYIYIHTYHVAKTAELHSPKRIF